MTTLEELEKLLTGLRAIVASYEKKNPLRTADFHGEGCSCHRCAVDGCCAAINALPGLIESARRVERLEKTAGHMIEAFDLLLPHMVGVSVPPEFNEKLRDIHARAKAMKGT